MSLMLKRGIEVVAGAALMVALLFVVPAVAQAQEGQGGARTTTSVVVKPGDTLWSISEERLGAKATPQRLAVEVERIYALNRERIGPDPNQIFAGQKLSLLPAGGSSSTEEAATKNKAQKTAHAATGTVEGAARGAKGRPADRQANHPTLPKAPTPAAAAGPAIGSPSTDTQTAAATLVGIFAESRATAGGRQLLSWGIIALTLIVGALMAWKLPMRRYTRDEIEVWGILSGYQGRRPYASSLHAYDAWSSGFSANGAASSQGARDVPGRRNIVKTELGEPDANREWEIGEPLRHALGNIPLVLGPSRSRALSEARPLAQDALETLAFLGQRRRLSSEEHSQAGAIRRLLAALEEEEAVYQGHRGARANGSKANGSKNGASRGTRHIQTTRLDAGIGGR